MTIWPTAVTKKVTENTTSQAVREATPALTPRVRQRTFLKHKYAGAPKSKSTVRHRSVAGPAQIPVWAMMKALKTVFKPQNKAGGSNPGGRGQGNCPHFLHKIVLCTCPSLLQSGRPPVREYDHSTYSMSRETFLITCLVMSYGTLLQRDKTKEGYWGEPPAFHRAKTAIQSEGQGPWPPKQ